MNGPVSGSQDPGVCFIPGNHNGQQHSHQFHAQRAQCRHGEAEPDQKVRPTVEPSPQLNTTVPAMPKTEAPQKQTLAITQATQLVPPPEVVNTVEQSTGGQNRTSVELQQQDAKLGDEFPPLQQTQSRKATRETVNTQEEETSEVQEANLVWDKPPPQRLWDKKKVPLFLYRRKQFFGMTCTSCGGAHPPGECKKPWLDQYWEVALPANSFPTIEIWCVTCHKDKSHVNHTSEEHDKQRFYDHPDNPQLPEHLHAFSNPAPNMEKGRLDIPPKDILIQRWDKSDTKALKVWKRECGAMHVEKTPLIPPHRVHTFDRARRHQLFIAKADQAMPGDQFNLQHPNSPPDTRKQITRRTRAFLHRITRTDKEVFRA